MNTKEGCQMNNNLELEIKILDVDVDIIKNKLDEIGAIYKKEVIQKIYTYDCYSPITMYELAISDYKITKSKNSLQKIINILSYIKPVISLDEQEIIKNITGYNYLEDYIESNYTNIKLSILNNKDIKKIIKNSKDKFFKWIRLRQSGDVAELTVKYIYNVATEYAIDEVKEIEIKVDNFDEANKLVEELGYYRRKLVEKKRTSYEFADNKIEIDQWPLIPPYIEIEGTNPDSIYDLASKLGYKKEDTKIMNTEDVYLLNGIDLTSFEELTFERSIKI